MHKTSSNKPSPYRFAEEGLACLQLSKGTIHYRTMKEALTSFDIRVLSRELSEIQGAYLDKVYQRGSSFVLKFNLPRVGRREVYIEPGKWLYVGKDLEKGPEPPALAQSLRKVLSNAVLREVTQRGFDRIVSLRFEREAEYTLVLEMFGSGNLVLLRDTEVMHAFRYGKWKTREVRRGRTYLPPPAFTDPTDLDLEHFKEILGDRQGALVRVLASGLGLGGLYAEETCLRAGVSKETPVRRLGTDEIEAVFEAISGLLDQLESPQPQVVLEGTPVDVIPFPLHVYEGRESKEFSTMSEAIKLFVESLGREKPVDETAEKLGRRIRRQEAALRDMEAEIERLGMAADYLYGDYQKVDRLLRSAREGTLLDGVDRVKRVLRIESQDVELELDYELDVDQNAKLLYETRKVLMNKVVGVRRALEESREGLDRAQTAGPRLVEKPRFRTPKRFWFDAYRWSLTSGGYLILGGRDARSNEKLVRKHLEPGDRYCHADLTGAPSVILKDGSKASEEDLKEACRFALVFSKAWKAGVGSGSAYWVTPEQVSKTAQSGEYLRTGSFVIRGRRNYFHNLSLALGVGLVEREGVQRVISADPSTMKKLADSYVVLEPAGVLGRAILVRHLSEAFQVPPEEVDRVLPAGEFVLRLSRGLELRLGEKD